MSLINDALKRARHSHAQQAATGAEGTPPAPSAPLQPVEYARTRTSSPLLIAIPIALITLGIVGWLFYRGSAARSEKPAPKVEAAAKTPATNPEQSVQLNPVAVAASTLSKREEPQQDESSTPVKTAASVPTSTVPPVAPVIAATPLPTDSNTRTTTRKEIAPVAIPTATQAASPSPEPAVAAQPVQQPAPQPTPLPDVTPAAQPDPAPAALITSKTQPAPTAQEIKLQGIFYRLKSPSALLDGHVVYKGDEHEGYRVIEIERHAVKLASSERTLTLTLR
jgi:hypothetical protein